MPDHAMLRRQWRKARRTAFWLALLLPLAMAIGSAVALFLWALERATQARFDLPWLIWLMPVAGFAMVWAYQRFGGSSGAGNNLIVDEIHQPGGGVPLRMAPFILVSTVLTHLVGGSAGREGTAVQIGGALAGGLGRRLALDPASLRILLICGIAAGFGAVFGTPLAGAIFALEVLMIGRIQYDALLPALVAALVGDWTVLAWGVGHVHYQISFIPTDVAGWFGGFFWWGSKITSPVSGSTNSFQMTRQEPGRTSAICPRRWFNSNTAPFSTGTCAETESWLILLLMPPPARHSRRRRHNVQSAPCADA